MKLDMAITRKLKEYEQNEKELDKILFKIYSTLGYEAVKELLTSFAEYEIKTLDDLNRNLSKGEIKSLLPEVIALSIVTNDLIKQLQKKEIPHKNILTQIIKTEKTKKSLKNGRFLVGEVIDFRINSKIDKVEIMHLLETHNKFIEYANKEKNKPVLVIEASKKTPKPQNEQSLQLEDQLSKKAIERQFEFAKKREAQELKASPNFRKNKYVSEVKTELNRKWLGQSYDERIHIIKLETSRAAHKAVRLGVALGRNPKAIAKDLVKEFGMSYEKEEDKSRLKGAYAKAVRLARTEFNFIANQATLNSYQNIGIEEYEILAELDNKTSDICLAFNGAIFKVDTAEVGVNYPPFHPNCRTTTVGITNLDR
jgi:SPP1 gp7 family putative phage head morphogenesis protein